MIGSLAKSLKRVEAQVNANANVTMHLTQYVIGNEEHDARGRIINSDVEYARTDLGRAEQRASALETAWISASKTKHAELLPAVEGARANVARKSAMLEEALSLEDAPLHPPRPPLPHDPDQHSEVQRHRPSGWL
jgi:hypothetical protein